MVPTTSKQTDQTQLSGTRNQILLLFFLPHNKVPCKLPCLLSHLLAPAECYSQANYPPFCMCEFSFSSLDTPPYVCFHSISFCLLSSSCLIFKIYLNSNSALQGCTPSTDTIRMLSIPLPRSLRNVLNRTVHKTGSCQTLCRAPAILTSVHF